MEQRKTKRFDIKLPVRIVRNGARPLDGTGITHNLSSAGVLFASDVRMDVGEPIEYVITLNAETRNAVDLHCLGKVLRFDGEGVANGGSAFQVAATLERYEFVRNGG